MMMTSGELQQPPPPQPFEIEQPSPPPQRPPPPPAEMVAASTPQLTAHLPRGLPPIPPHATTASANPWSRRNSSREQEGGRGGRTRFRRSPTDRLLQSILNEQDEWLSRWQPGYGVLNEREGRTRFGVVWERRGLQRTMRMQTRGRRSRRRQLRSPRAATATRR